jgi:RecJ-like exonuclease
MESRKRKYWLWWGLLALALAGLGWRWFQREVALVRIADLPAARQAAVVRIAGKAVGVAQVSRAGGQISGLRFTLADGTGQLTVTADASQARQLARWARIPRAGDAVEVTGRLRSAPVSGWQLELRSDTALKLRRGVPPRSGKTARLAV